MPFSDTYPNRTSLLGARFLLQCHSRQHKCLGSYDDSTGLDFRRTSGIQPLQIQGSVEISIENQAAMFTVVRPNTQNQGD